MDFFSHIRSWFIWATNVLVNWALFFYGWGGIGEWLGDLCSNLSDFTSEVAGYFWDASNWWEEVEWAISDILSWSNIRSLIRSWLDGIEDALDWWDRWWVWVGQEIEDWWPTVWDTIWGWIDAATQGFNDLLAAWDTFWNVTWPQWTSYISELRSLWDTFWTTIFPNLVDFAWLGIWWDTRLLDIQGLIDTAIEDLLPFLEGWQEIKDSVLEFFADPLGWLESRFTDWFLGAE